jgi:hypothetical protein
MAEIRDGDASFGWGRAAPTLVGIAAIVGIAYWCEHAYRRWLKEIHPLAGHRARMQRMSTGYRSKKSNASEFVRLINDVLDEVARAAR